jgi:hypothetical protein
MAPGNIWASFGTAGIEGDVYAVQLDRPNAVPVSTENIQLESISRSLSWLLEVPYDLTPITLGLTSVSASTGTYIAALAQQALAGSGSGAIASLSGSFAPLELLAGSGSGLIATLTTSSVTPTPPTGGTRVTGVAPPELGDSPATDYTEWTRIVNGSQNNNFIEFAGWPFTFSLAGTAYGSCYISSNGFASFGSGSSQSDGLSASSPNLPKIMFGPQDLSWQRVYTQTANHYVKFRWEGDTNASGGGGPGASNRIIEITFWKPGQSTQLIEIRTGDWYTVEMVELILASASTAYSASPLDAYENWVLEGNLAGTSWTLYGGSYVVAS